jgi:putative glutamine amidotransferase
MAVIAVTSDDLRNARRYIQVIESLGLVTRLITPETSGSSPAPQLMDDAGALLLTGGPDIDPSFYGESVRPDAGVEIHRDLDDLEFRVLDYALEQDMPVLAICRGMQLLNVAFGGKLIQDLPDHRAEQKDGRWVPKSHLIYLAPGAKAAAVIGSAGFFKVNSLHHQGLKEAQRAPRLMATAFSVDDGLVEGLESPEHSWVIGMQCHPERQDEVPRSFANLFKGLQERSEAFSARR